MKKYLMPAILAILFTNSLSAFEVYGIKSGMTKEEYYAAVDCQAGVDKYNVGKTGKYDTKASLDWCEDSSLRDLPYFEGMYPGRFLEWTHDDRIWRLHIRVTKSDGIISGIAQRNAMEKAFPGKEITESSSTSKYGTTEYLSIFFIDNKVFQESLNHYEKKYLDLFNTKK